MRVIAGEARGRRLTAPRGSAVRPTSDRVREALFDILSDHVREASFLDLYAGTGAVGIEALSRGAARATFVEQDPLHARILMRNLETCRLEDRARLLRMPVAVALRRLSGERDRFRLIFVDPPYDLPGERLGTLEGLLQGGLLDPAAVLVVEGPARTPPPAAAGLEVERTVRYGDTALSFYRALPDSG